MAPASPSTKGLALIATAFDAQTSALVASALTLARRFQVKLRFVSVVETQWENPVIDTPYYGVSPLVLSEVREQELEERRGKMKELLAKLPADVVAEGDVFAGDATQGLIADAIVHGANLVMTAANIDSYGTFTPRGFSKAMSLMAEAPLPVLVTSAQAPFDAGKPGFSILVSDDLQPDTEEAVRRGYELAAKLGKGTKLHHLHVHGDFREALGSVWSEIRTAVEARLGTTEGARDRILAAEEAARLERLAERPGAYGAEAKAAGVEVKRLSEIGQVGDAIHEAAVDIGADLLVFGRHKWLRARPFIIGRVPLTAMLKAGRPLLVVPAGKDLYAPVAFPTR